MLNAEDVAPNQVTFATVLTALRNLLPADEKRVGAVATVFGKCKEMGMCDLHVTKRLQSVLDTKQLKELVGDEWVNDNGVINIALLPKEWTRNVQSRFKKQDNSKIRPIRRP